MKKFFSEFKKFITRGNVLDMAVGVIMGAAFTAIINGFVKGIFTPLITACTGNGFDSFVTILWPSKVIAPELVETTKGVVEFNGKFYTNLVYIDWGMVINAIINFLVTALILFTIIKAINAFREKGTEVGKIYKEKKRAHRYAMWVKKNEKLVAKGKEPKPIPAKYLPPKPVVEKAPEPKPVDPQIQLLTEIRDLLNKEQTPVAENTENK